MSRHSYSTRSRQMILRETVARISPLTRDGHEGKDPLRAPDGAGRMRGVPRTAH
jgi:hypothetical protein